MLRASSFALCSLLGLFLTDHVLTAQSKRTQRDPADYGWPFAVPKGAGARATLSRRDLYNLGILGAKAWDADTPDPAPRAGGGRRRFQGTGKPAKDVGPQRLVIRAIHPEGPARRAGLKLGDIVTAISGKNFKKGCFEVLAKALSKAESTKGKNVLTLKIERDGKKLDLDVKVPYLGKELAKPTVGKGRSIILRKALDWLAEKQESSGGFAASLGGNNGVVVMTSLAGLAWLASGSSAKRGKFKKNIARAHEFVVKGLTAKSPFAGRMPQGASWDQTNWAYAHVGIFLGELYAADGGKQLKRELETVAQTLSLRQEASGGYAHGPGGKNALGYLELNIMAGFVMTTLGLTKQAGCQVDDQVHERLLAYCKSSAGGGGVGYSTASGQKGQGNIGRTAGAWLGAVACGLRSQKFVKRMGSWAKSHIADVLDGHATLMQHILLAGVAAPALGKKASTSFWKGLRRDFTLARSPDGSFQSRPWHESLTMNSNTDVTMGQVWTTACWAIVLGAGDKNGSKLALPAWTGRKK